MVRCVFGSGMPPLGASRSRGERPFASGPFVSCPGVLHQHHHSTIYTSSDPVSTALGSVAFVVRPNYNAFPAVTGTGT